MERSVLHVCEREVFHSCCWVDPPQLSLVEKCEKIQFARGTFSPVVKAGGCFCRVPPAVQ